MIPIEKIPLAILYVLTQWTVFKALYVFPPLMLAVRIWQTRDQQGVSLIDRIMPAPGTTRSIASNMVLSLINTFGWASVMVLFNAVLQDFWAETVGVTPPEPMADWWLPAQVLAIVVLFDFVNYWSHRLLHRPWMWGIHQLHHSDEHMNFSTSNRIHVLEAVQMNFVSIMMIGWFIVPAEALGIALVIRGWYGMYVHSRLPWDHGPLKRVLASPNYHDWHHCDDPAVYGKNLCDMFPVWDIAFGTYYNPGRCDKPLGVSDAPDDIIAGQIYPFLYWARLWKNHRARRSALAVEPLQAEPAAQ